MCVVWNEEMWKMDSWDWAWVIMNSENILQNNYPHSSSSFALYLQNTWWLFVSWSLFYAPGTDGGRWVALGLRVFKANSNNRAATGQGSYNFYTHSSQQPSGILLLSYHLQIKWGHWVVNLSKITQPEVVESQFEPRVSGSRIHDSGYFAIKHCVIFESFLATWCPKLESEPSFNLCFVWSLLIMI